MKQQTEICSPTVTARSAPKAVGGRDATFPEAGRRGRRGRRSVSALGPARPCAVSRLPLAAAGPGRAEPGRGCGSAAVPPAVAAPALWQSWRRLLPKEPSKPLPVCARILRGQVAVCWVLWFLVYFFKSNTSEWLGRWIPQKCFRLCANPDHLVCIIYFLD